MVVVKHVILEVPKNDEKYNKYKRMWNTKAKCKLTLNVNKVTEHKKRNLNTHKDRQNSKISI
jgi:hypothetical protein